MDIMFLIKYNFEKPLNYFQELYLKQLIFVLII
jgi:hypothetical protein